MSNNYGKLTVVIIKKGLLLYIALKGHGHAILVHFKNQIYIRASNQGPMKLEVVKSCGATLFFNNASNARFKSRMRQPYTA